MLSIVMWLVTFVAFQEDLKCQNIINLLIQTLYKSLKLAQEFLYDWFLDKRSVGIQALQFLFQIPWLKYFKAI